MTDDLLFHHTPWLFVTSIGICLLGAFAGAILWRSALAAEGWSRSHWGFLAAVNLGATVWTTHFVAMLGYRHSAMATFDPGFTGASVAVAMVGLCMAVGLSLVARTTVIQVLSGIAVGVGISVLHMVGMMGFELGVAIQPSAFWSVEGLTLGCLFGFAAVRVLQTVKPRRIAYPATALTFSLGVASIHFTAMASFHAALGAVEMAGEPISHSGLAVAVSIATLILIATGVSAFVIQHSMSSVNEASLRRAAVTDALTQVANREGFNDELARAFDGWRGGDRPFALMFIDLDRFKPVNDVFGHPIGDEVLRRVVGRLRAILSPADVLARLGGDEFAVILKGPDAADDAAETRATQIVDLLARPFLIDTRVIEIGASVGLAGPRAADGARDASGPQAADGARETPGAPDGGVAICRRADMALYEAKENGRGTWRRFDEDIGERFEARHLLEADLRRALGRDEFVLYFQPVVDAESGGIVSAEALLRWNHPTRGLLPPSAFIPLMEDLGLVIPVGKWVMDRACREAAAWPEPLIVSVNISPVQLRDPRLVQTVAVCLETSGLPPERLDLEVTETALLDNEDRGLQILNELRRLGVSISLDDFGTGFSSLSHLHRFPLDRIKIDRAFFASADTDPKSARIVEAISHLGTVLGLGVTAEGIETPEQLARAQRNKCDVVQGYLVSMPLHPDAFGAFVADRGAGPETGRAAS